MLARISIIIFLLCLIFRSSSQTPLKIHGQITDSSGTFLSSINVIAYDLSDSSMLAFTMSDSIGYFSLEIDSVPDSLFLEATMIGYENVRIKLIKPIQENIQITLPVSTQNLEEVIIKEKTFVIRHEDTLIYNLDAFRDSSERNVGELLNKLPGVDVDANGKVKVRGQEIQNIRIDGDDITKDKYEIITNTLSADFVKKAEIIFNYQGNRLLQKMESSRAISINLITDQHIKGKWNTDAELSIGTQGRYDDKINSLGLYKKIKIISALNANRIGKGLYAPLWNQDDFTNNFSLGHISYSGYEQNLRSDNHAYQTDNAFHYRISPDAELRVNAGLQGETSDQNKSYQLLLPDGTEIRNESIHAHSKIKDYYLSTSIETYFSDKAFIDFNIKYVWSHEEMNQLNPASTWSSSLSPSWVRIGFTGMIRPLSKVLLTTSFSLIPSRSTSGQIYSQDSLQVYEFTNHHDTLFTDRSLSSIPWSVKQSAYYALGNHRIIAFVGIEHSDYAHHLISTWTFRSNNTYHFQNIYYGLRWEFQSEHGWQIAAGIHPTYYSVISEVEKRSMDLFRNSGINSDLSLRLKLSTKTNAEININKSFSMDPLSIFPGTPFYLRSRYSISGKNDIVPFASGWSIGGTIRSDNIIPVPTSSFMNVTFIRGEQNITSSSEYLSPGFIYQKYLPIGSAVSSFDLSVGHDRRITPLQTFFKMRPSIKVYEFQSSIEGELINSRQTNIDITVSARTSFKLPINCEMGMNPNVFITRSEKQSGMLWKDKNTIQSTFFNLLYRHESFGIKWLNSYFTTKSMSQLSISSWQSSAEIFIKLSKKLDLEIKGYNLYNAQAIQNIYYSASYQSISKDYLIPRTVLFYFQFKI